MQQLFKRLKQQTKKKISHPAMVYHPEIKILQVYNYINKIDWGLRLYNIPSIWEKTKGSGIKILVLDTGYPTHTDFNNSIIKWKDFTGTNYIDTEGHATAVSGVIGARKNIMGVAPESILYAGKVLGKGGGNYNWLIEGIKWGISEKVDIINMSLGGSVSQTSLRSIIQKAVNNNIIIIAAAGNEGKIRNNTINYPAKYPETIAVGSINKNSKVSEFSSIGEELDFVGPGERIFTTYLNNKYTVIDGTSFAAPFISGIVALMLSKHRKYGGKTPCRNQKEVKEHLIKAAIDMGNPGKDIYYGWGRVDIPKLLAERV